MRIAAVRVIINTCFRLSQHLSFLQHNRQHPTPDLNPYSHLLQSAICSRILEIVFGPIIPSSLREK